MMDEIEAKLRLALGMPVDNATPPAPQQEPAD